MKRIYIGPTVVEVRERHVLSILADGARIEAEPHETAEYAATAESLGYGSDVEAMNRDHELMHHILAHALGLPESPVMRAVADDTWQHDPDGKLKLEEDAVMAVQRLARAYDVDLAHG